METNSQKRRFMRRFFLRGLIIAIGLLLSLTWCWWTMISMPGESFSGELPNPDAAQISLREELHRDVEHLSVTIGRRNVDNYPALCRAADYVQEQFEKCGYRVARQKYQVRGLDCWNLEVEISGVSSPDEIVIVGGHYDSFVSTPGANDNASGTAAVLALARRFAGKKTAQTLRFVAFTNEEPPHFQTPDMGSWVYARRCRRREENLVAVLSLETIGYYSDHPGSQKYPPPFSLFYPSEGDFIAVVGNVGSRKLVRRVVDSFRRHARFPSEGGAVPGEVTGVGWSDHWSFWQEGYSAVEITDTAPFRYPYYHKAEDTPDKLNFEHMARVVDGLEHVIGELTGVMEE